jgi:hypothetical protein
MAWYHNFSNQEIRAATGLPETEIEKALQKFHITAANTPPRLTAAPLLTLPYPGGRHPRIGFLDGAIDPQRETKISVFAPWDRQSYVVVDLPEAIWLEGELLYLAHTHLPTIWSKRNIKLEKLEWNRRTNGSLDYRRKLPNGVSFGAEVVPESDIVRMNFWLRNDTEKTLGGLRLQICNMLKGMAGFTELTEKNLIKRPPYGACRSADGRRYVITCWQPAKYIWLNPAVPCYHCDPQLPDCKAGQTQRARGVISFYEGDDLQSEFRRLDETLSR